MYSGLDECVSYYRKGSTRCLVWHPLSAQQVSSHMCCDVGHELKYSMIRGSGCFTHPFFTLTITHYLVAIMNVHDNCQAYSVNLVVEDVCVCVCGGGTL